MVPALGLGGVRRPRPIPTGPSTIGFDGSYSGDATAIVAVEIGPCPTSTWFASGSRPGRPKR